MSDQNAYLKYCHEVLGIRHIVPAEVESVEMPDAASDQWVIYPGQSQPLIVLSLVSPETASLMEPSVKALYDKMIAAMKMSNIMVIEGSANDSLSQLVETLKTIDYSLGVVFCASESDLPDVFSRFGIWERFAGGRFIATRHPSFLLEHADEKRVVWNHLKMVMSEVQKNVQ